MLFGTTLRMIFMPNYSKNEIILVRYPFSDLSSSKVRPAVVVSTPHPSQDILIVPLTSRTASLLDGEFLLSDWSAAGLNVANHFSLTNSTSQCWLGVPDIASLKPFWFKKDFNSSHNTPLL